MTRWMRQLVCSQSVWRLRRRLARSGRRIRRRMCRGTDGKPILDGRRRARLRASPISPVSGSSVGLAEAVVAAAVVRAPPRRRAHARSERHSRVAVLRGRRPRIRAAASAVGRRAEEEAHGRQQQGQPRRVVPADRPDAVPQSSAAATDRADEEPDAHHLRIELRSALHLHRRTAGAEQRPDSRGGSATHAAGGRATTLVVETTNFLGDERAGWLDVNGSPYTDALKMTERFRRPNFGTMRDRHHHRRREGLHQAVHGAREPSHHGGFRDDRVHLQRERAIDASHRTAGRGRRSLQRRNRPSNRRGGSLDPPSDRPGGRRCANCCAA